MSAVALSSGRQSPFLEVWFDRKLPQREVEHPGPPIWSEVLHLAMDALHSALIRIFRRDSFVIYLKPSTQIYMDLSYIDPQTRVLNYCIM